MKEFITVKGKKRKHIDPVSFELSDSKNTTINNSNRFKILGEIKIDQMQRNIQKNGFEEDAKKGSQTVSYFPPITIKNFNVQKLVDQLKAKNIDFKINNKSRYKCKLYVRDEGVHQEMMALLENKEMDSYSFIPKALKKTRIILRGVYYKENIVDIKKE